MLHSVLPCVPCLWHVSHLSAVRAFNVALIADLPEVYLAFLDGWVHYMFYASWLSRRSLILPLPPPSSRNSTTARESKFYGVLATLFGQVLQLRNCAGATAKRQRQHLAERLSPAAAAAAAAFRIHGAPDRLVVILVSITDGAEQLLRLLSATKAHG